MNPTIPFERLVLDPRGVADLLKISKRHVLNLREQDPSFPEPRTCGTNRPRWHINAILAWLEAGSPSGPTPPASDQRRSTTKASKDRGVARVH